MTKALAGAVSESKLPQLQVPLVLVQVFVYVALVLLTLPVNLLLLWTVPFDGDLSMINSQDVESMTVLKMLLPMHYMVHVVLMVLS